MSYCIFLDDERQPQGDRPWPMVICRNYEQFVATITERGRPASIEFDHDLGLYSKNGRECAQWFVGWLNERSLPLPICSVHSMNVIGAQEIKAVLQSYAKVTGRSAT